MNNDDKIDKLNELASQMDGDQKLQVISEISSLFQSVGYESGKDR